jgi:hypothetical protein
MKHSSIAQEPFSPVLHDVAAGATAARERQAAQQVLDTFRTWLRGQGGDDLVASAALLGGSKWESEAQRFVDAVLSHAEMGDLLVRAKSLLRLLSLELVDEGGIEASLFGMLYPDDPRAHVAMLCCEALDRVRPALAVLARPAPSDARVAA